MAARTLEAELLLDARADLGEGPMWHADRGQVSWVDLYAGRLNWLALDGTAGPSVDVGYQLGCAVPGFEKAIGIGGVAHADLAEGIDDALMREDAVGERKLLAKGGKVVGHGMLLGTDRLVARLSSTQTGQICRRKVPRRPGSANLMARAPDALQHAARSAE